MLLSIGSSLMLPYSAGSQQQLLLYLYIP